MEVPECIPYFFFCCIIFKCHIHVHAVRVRYRNPYACGRHRKTRQFKYLPGFLNHLLLFFCIAIFKKHMNVRGYIVMTEMRMGRRRWPSGAFLEVPETTVSGT